MSLIAQHQARVVSDGSGVTEKMLSAGNEHPLHNCTMMPDTEGCSLDGSLKDNFGDVVNGNPST